MVSLMIITAGRKVLQGSCLVKDKQFGEIEIDLFAEVAGQGKRVCTVRRTPNSRNGSGSTPEEFRQIRFRRT